VSATKRARIHYRRLPDDEQLFDQLVVLERDDVIVTLTDPIAIGRPMLVGGAPILEPRSRVVWFTFPGRWHDVGRFHRADGTFTGFYANILTPPEIDGSDWHTTDLFLDLWLPADGGVMLLDEHELAEALSRGHIDGELARQAEAEAQHVLRLVATGDWPPPVVREWTLERSMSVEAGPTG
jgi:predicted RNA-binding protein associated with RNAse of E/G family